MTKLSLHSRWLKIKCSKCVLYHVYGTDIYVLQSTVTSPGNVDGKLVIVVDSREISGAQVSGARLQAVKYDSRH